MREVAVRSFAGRRYAKAHKSRTAECWLEKRSAGIQGTATRPIGNDAFDHPPDYRTGHDRFVTAFPTIGLVLPNQPGKPSTNFAQTERWLVEIPTNTTNTVILAEAVIQ